MASKAARVFYGMDDDMALILGVGGTDAMLMNSTIEYFLSMGL